MNTINEVETIITNGKFCNCGGLMTANNSKVLLSDPAKVEVTCPFCGSIAYTLAPYNVMIGFKLRQSKG